MDKKQFTKENLLEFVEKVKKSILPDEYFLTEGLKLFRGKSQSECLEKFWEYKKTGKKNYEILKRLKIKK